MSETSNTYQLSPRILLTSGDPVKVAGRRGLFRFVRIEQGQAVLIGPIKGAEGERIVPVDTLRSAGRATRQDVAMSAEAADITRRAQRRR